jgi:hypothetical protein
MRTALLVLCLGAFVADAFFCGGSKTLSTQQEAKFDNDARAADESLVAVDEAIKRIEEAPEKVEFADLRATDDKLAECEKSLSALEKDKEPYQHFDGNRAQRLSGLKGKLAKMDERLTAAYRKRLGEATCARLDAATKAAERLNDIERKVATAEEVPASENITHLDRRGQLVATTVGTYLRDIGDELVEVQKAFAGVDRFVDGPSREKLRPKQLAQLKAAFARHEDLTKRCDAVRQARGLK